MSSAIRQPNPSPFSGSPGQCFDLAHFESQTFGDPALQREIMGLFLKQLDDVSVSLSAPITLAAWRYLTHTLKGAAAAVGAVAIARLATQWELEGAPLEPEGRLAAHALFMQEYSVLRLVVAGYSA